MNSFFKKENRIPCPFDIEEVIKNIDENYSDFEEDLDEVKAIVRCTGEYLNLYNAFATGNPPEDNLVNDIYNKTTNMIDKAKESREIQIQTVEEKMEEYTEEIAMYRAERNREQVEELKDAMYIARETFKSLNKDIKELDKIGKYCETANDKTKKILCVEKFVHSAHTRGPYIPLGCGGYLEEILSETMESGAYISPINEVTSLLESMTNDVLDCLRDYK